MTFKEFIDIIEDLIDENGKEAVLETLKNIIKFYEKYNII